MKTGSILVMVMSMWSSALASGFQSTKTKDIIQHESTRMAMVQRAKRVDVARLDASLASEPLGEWFFTLAGPRTYYMNWDTVTCGLPKVTDYGLCVRVEATWIESDATVTAIVDVRVGEKGGGLKENPEIYDVVVEVVQGGREAEGDEDLGYQTGKRLGDLVSLLERTRSRLAEKLQRTK